MRWKVIGFILFSSFSVNAAPLFLGDSIAQGFKIATGGVGETQIGANPREVSGMITRAKKEGVVYLSSGISNNCKDTWTAKDNIRRVVNKYTTSFVFSAPFCGEGVEKEVLEPCKRSLSCTIITFPTRKDGVHPVKYFNLKDKE